MAKQDYVPKTDNDFLAWHDNLAVQLAVLATQFDIKADEVTAIKNLNTNLHQAATDANAAKVAAAAKSTAKQTAFKEGIAAARALANRIKAHPNFSEALGRQLGVVGAEDSTDLSDSAPTLKVANVVPGSVTLGFSKSVSSGVRIISRRGTESAFSLLAIDTESPYIDTRPNLTTSPETRHYQAQYLWGDDPIGHLSQTIIVTVPGT